MKRIAIISPDSTDEMIMVLKMHDIETVKIPVSNRVAPALAGHPDLQIFVHGTRVFCHTHISPDFLKKIENHAEIILCPSILSSDYPGDIPFNIACTGTHAFHLFSHCDEMVSRYLSDNGIKKITVKQGYSKCSTLIVSEKSIITQDTSIHRCALGQGISSLLIQPGHIDLPGYSFGFIGGASGLCGDQIFFSGSLEHHPDYEPMMEFIAAFGKKAVFLSEQSIIDLGSILFIGL